ncbi:MAG: DUF2093 domain-containing protein [Alphaproteobacteria bacterium]|jgi:hypothetical protein|nr:DUF2093 domain-containing protein [Alphaproteobacteria bacterium]
MNAYDKFLGEGGRPAVVHYGDGEMTVLRAGDYVICAVSGQRVPLAELRYWSPKLQEAYAGAAEATQRFLQLQAEGRA